MKFSSWLVAALCGAAFCAGTSNAAPREAALRADLVRGLTDVCLPAQAQGTTARQFIRGKRRDLGLKPVGFSNKARSDAWSVSNDRRAFVYSEDERCYVSAEVELVGDDRTLASDIHADLLALSVTEPSIAGSIESGNFAAGYCTQMSDGSLASYNMWATITGLEPGTGRIAPARRLVLFVVAPKTSECGR